MRSVVLVLLLMAPLALAQGVSEAVDAGAPPVPAGTVALYASAATAAALATAALASFAGALLPTAAFEARGRPDPLALAGGFAIAALLNAAVLHLAVPLLTAMGQSGDVAASTKAARANAWRASRWALLGAAVGLVVLTAGAVAERDQFGSGQWPMLAGAGTLVASMGTFDVLEAVYAWQGFVAARREGNR
ncbi:MAG: hypothetical protein IAE78_01200 [Myxococcus sp.]|nr:hypothetical protein [Myxococcus sp.]